MRAGWLIVVCGCANPAASATALHAGAVDIHLERTTVAIPGEAMEFRVMFRGVAVGEMQTVIGQVGQVDARRAVIVRSHGRGEGLVSMFVDVSWELATTLDLDTGFPISDHEDAWTVFQGKHEHGQDGRVWRDDDREHDVHSAFGAIRAWRSERGQRTQLDVRVGGGQFEISLTDTGREYLASAKSRAVRYEGSVDEKFPFAMWVSDDMARVPLLVRTDTKWGTVTAEMVDYQPAANE